MSTFNRIALPALQLVEIAGRDAIAFAQAQFSSNLDELASGSWQWSAWLSAQGRVRAFFHLLRDDDEHLRLILRGGSAASLRDALARYVLRADVTLRAIEHGGAFVERLSLDGEGIAKAQQAKRIEYSLDSCAIIVPGSPLRRLTLRNIAAATLDADASEAARNEHELADINAGLVTLAPALEDKLLPAWIGLDTLGATSTNKGCYPGQEIVARLHFKGGNKRHLHRIAFDAARLPEPGMPLGEGAVVICSARVERGRAVALAVLDEHAAEASSNLAAPGISDIRIERAEPKK